jgi:uncharacterized protein (DUF2384 family)
MAAKGKRLPASATEKEVLAVSWGSPQLAARALSTATAMQRIGLVRTGVPAKFVWTLTRHLQLPRERFVAMAGFSMTSISKKVTKTERLDLPESERVLGFLELIAQVESVARSSKSLKKLNSAKWLGSWLDRPQSVLGGRKPGDLMDTADGREVVRGLLSMQRIAAPA